MSPREDDAKESRLRHIGSVILDIPRKITDPAPSITKEIDRRKARFLSVALLTATTVYPILQITSEVTMGIPYRREMSSYGRPLSNVKRRDTA